MNKVYQVFFRDETNELKAEYFAECRKATSFARGKSKKSGSTVSVYQDDGMGTIILWSTYFNGKKTF